MRIVYRAGDFLAGPEPVSCHGCNMQGRMGGSVATQVRERFPPAFDAYAAAHARGRLRLGRVIPARCDGRAVANAVTQQFYGNSAKTGVRYLDYDGLSEAMAELDRAAACGWPRSWGGAIAPFSSVAFPLIGAGLAGGHWPAIAAIIERESLNFTPVVYTRDGHPPP